MGMEAFKRFEQVWSGHFHTKSSQGNITYLGSQLEFTWADAHDPKYFHIFDTDTRIMSPVHNSVTLFEKIIYDDKTTDYSTVDVQKFTDKFIKIVVVHKSDPYSFDKFVDRINDVGVHDLKIAESFDEFAGMNTSDNNITVEDTTELLDGYVMNVETDLNKERIKQLMQEVYIEALNLEVV